MFILILYLSTMLFSFKVVEVEACGWLTPYCKSGHIKLLAISTLHNIVHTMQCLPSCDISSYKSINLTYILHNYEWHIYALCIIINVMWGDMSQSSNHGKNHLSRVFCSFQKSTWKASCQAFSPVVVNHCT